MVESSRVQLSYGKVKQRHGRVMYSEVEAW